MVIIDWHFSTVLLGLIAVASLNSYFVKADDCPSDGLVQVASTCLPLQSQLPQLIAIMDDLSTVQSKTTSYSSADISKMRSATSSLCQSSGPLLACMNLLSKCTSVLGMLGGLGGELPPNLSDLIADGSQLMKTMCPDKGLTRYIDCIEKNNGVNIRYQDCGAYQGPGFGDFSSSFSSFADLIPGGGGGGMAPAEPVPPLDCRQFSQLSGCMTASLQKYCDNNLANDMYSISVMQGKTNEPPCPMPPTADAAAAQYRQSAPATTQRRPPPRTTLPPRPVYPTGRPNPPYHPATQNPPVYPPFPPVTQPNPNPPPAPDCNQQKPQPVPTVPAQSNPCQPCKPPRCPPARRPRPCYPPNPCPPPPCYYPCPPPQPCYPRRRPCPRPAYPCQQTGYQPQQPGPYQPNPNPYPPNPNPYQPQQPQPQPNPNPYQPAPLPRPLKQTTLSDAVAIPMALYDWSDEDNVEGRTGGAGTLIVTSIWLNLALSLAFRLVLS